MTKTIKRLLSVVLCLVMCFSLLPAAAFADVGDESAQTQEDAAAIPGEDGEIVADEEEDDLTDGGDTGLSGDAPTGGDGLSVDNDLPEDDGLSGDNDLPEGDDLDGEDEPELTETPNIVEGAENTSVFVRFICKPDDTFVRVWAAPAEGETLDEKEESIAPENDGSFLLAPGKSLKACQQRIIRSKDCIV